MILSDLVEDLGNTLLFRFLTPSPPRVLVVVNVAGDVFPVPRVVRSGDLRGRLRAFSPVRCENKAKEKGALTR